jgi:phosphoribosyl 1,2-cyclic phosphate phosphodiesterase
LREQLLREGIGWVHAVLFTHGHADHLFGLDDTRVLADYLGHELPLYCDAELEQRIRQAFSYAFDPVVQNGPGGGVPRLAFQRLTERPFRLLGAHVLPVPLWHGPQRVFGFRVGSLAYCTDTNRIPPDSMRLLEGLDVLVLDCLRRRPHGTHFNLEQALEVVRQLRPKRTLLTHICHELDHVEACAELPAGVELAYDGLTVPLGPPPPEAPAGRVTADERG